ncbi:TPA: YkvA family protein [Neisseria subflava]
MTHSPHQNTPDPEDYIPSFRHRNLDTSGFMKKLGRFAGRLGKPVVRQLYALYYLWESEHTPKRAKMIIVGTLVYFLSPIDSIPDLLIPFGFSDDIAVIALVYSQMKNYLTEDIQEKARQAADKLFGS